MSTSTVLKLREILTSPNVECFQIHLFQWKTNFKATVHLYFLYRLPIYNFGFFWYRQRISLNKRERKVTFPQLKHGLFIRGLHSWNKVSFSFLIFYTKLIVCFFLSLYACVHTHTKSNTTYIKFKDREIFIFIFLNFIYKILCLSF